MSHTELIPIIELIHRHHRPVLEGRLCKAFPRACRSQVEDAIADAFTDALERPASFIAAWQRGGDQALLGLFYQVAWRHLRAYFRKKASRCEVPSGALPAVVSQLQDWLTPYVLASGRETEARAMALVDEAARRFGGGKQSALRAALWGRLAGGTDTEVARAHQVPREYVNRAKRWIGTQLTSEARGQ